MSYERERAEYADDVVTVCCGWPACVSKGFPRWLAASFFLRTVDRLIFFLCTGDSSPRAYDGDA
jgi:hypothetical protein